MRHQAEVEAETEAAAVPAATSAAGAAAATALGRVTVVTVTHDSAAVIGGFLAACPPGLRVIVVDNASADGTVAAVLAAVAAAPEGSGAVRLLRMAANRGFGAGCNHGLAAVETEFALLANPDARLSAEAVARLVAAADHYPEAAILAPALRAAPDAAHPAGRLVRSWDAAQHRRRVLARRRTAEPWPEGPLCTWYVSGAAMLLRPAEPWLRFDEGFFLYYEDDDLCARATARGRAVLLVPEAAVTHAGGRSSAPSHRLAWRKAFHMARSRLRFTARHRGAGAARVEALGRLGHHAAKALGHAVTAQGGKLLADLAAGCATLGWLLPGGGDRGEAAGSRLPGPSAGPPDHDRPGWNHRGHQSPSSNRPAPCQPECGRADEGLGRPAPDARSPRT